MNQIQTKYEKYYINALDLIEDAYPERDRHWCIIQLNRALDNTEFHKETDEDTKCKYIDGILLGEFGIRTKQNERIIA